MRVAVGADHAGFHLKEQLAELLKEQGHEVFDVGAREHDPADDFPDFALALAQRVAAGDSDRGIMICGSGVGASVAANKTVGIRAAVCHDSYSAHQGVEHDDMNVLCIGARIVGLEVAKELVANFLAAEFSGEERHWRRLRKVNAMEDAAFRRSK